MAKKQASKRPGGLTAQAESDVDRVTWYLYPFNFRSRAWMSKGSFGASVDASEGVGIYRLSDTEVAWLKRSFPNHDPLNPPWHLIEFRMFGTCGRDLRSVDASDVVRFFRPAEVAPSGNKLAKDKPTTRWGVPKFPPGACGDFGEAVLSLCMRARSVSEDDLSAFPAKSGMAAVLGEWPDVQALFDAARLEAEERSRMPDAVADCLLGLIDEVDSLKASVVSFMKWYDEGKGDPGRCSEMKAVALLTELRKIQPLLSHQDEKAIWLQSVYRFSESKLKLKQKAVVKLVIEGGGSMGIPDIAADEDVQWMCPYDNSVEGIMKALNPKLAEVGATLRRRDNSLEIARIQK